MKGIMQDWQLTSNKILEPRWRPHRPHLLWRAFRHVEASLWRLD